MRYRISFLFIIFLSAPAGVSAQQKVDMKDCKSALKGFIIDEQDYIINNTNVTRINIVFYHGFTYRLAICSDIKDNNFELTLTNEQGAIQYKNTVEQGFIRDFRFETIFRGEITIKPIKTDKQTAKLLIGYKKIEEQ